MELILLTLRTYCSSAPREAVSSLIQFIADVFLSLFRDQHTLEARVERILASKSESDASTLSESSMSPHCSAISLEEILAAPLVIPDVSATLLEDDDVHTQPQ